MGNPFYQRGMIKEKESFFGRQSELARTFDRLRVMQSVSVVGGPKVGKSSFLYQIALTAPERLGAGYTCHYLDLQGVTSDREFYGRAVAALGGGGDSHRDLQRAIEGKKAVLCLDEFENAADSASFDADFFNVMRSLAQTGNLALVVATQTPLPELSRKSTVRTSPFYNIFVPLPLDSLTEPEARQMLAALSARGGRPFDDDEMAWAIKAAGTHPWRLQVLAYHFFEAGEQGEPDRARVKRLYREEIRLAGRPSHPAPDLPRSWLWRGLGLLGRLARWVGNFLDEAQNVLIGVAVVVAIILILLRLLPVEQALEWLRGLFGG